MEVSVQRVDHWYWAVRLLKGDFDFESLNYKIV